jgi:thiol-disulfide isomerase/thioredoxin
MIGAGAGAAALGVNLAWRTIHPPAPPAGTQVFWGSRFKGMDGGELSPSAWFGKPLLVNFWATWCPPCVKELPEINQFYKEARGRGWQVLGLALDQLEPVKAFLQKTPLDFPVALAGANGLGLVRALGNESGGLPFSVVFDEGGTVSWRRLGVTTLADLRELAKT